MNGGVGELGGVEVGGGRPCGRRSTNSAIHKWILIQRQQTIESDTLIHNNLHRCTCVHICNMYYKDTHTRTPPR